MKNIKTLIVFLIISSSLFSQNHKYNEYQEKVNKMKIAFITDRVELSSNEAQSFWPIYNEYNRNIISLRKEYTDIIRSFKKQDRSLTDVGDNEAKGLIEKELKIEESIVNEKRTLVNNLQGIISNQKILMLFKAEKDFNKKLLERLKRRNNKKDNNFNL